jgi:hypothetical protein
MQRFVDGRYRLMASATFDGALRLAVERIRLTNLPVAITVSHGNHGWLLTGFTATADPAVTEAFTVTSVRVVGPLYGLQSRNGYDMKPNTELTPAQLKRFFTPWRYAPLPMIWDGTYVSIQPAPASSSAPVPTRAPAPSKAPAPAATTAPAAAPSPMPSPDASHSAEPISSPRRSPSAAPSLGPDPSPAFGAVAGSPSPAVSPDSRGPTAANDRSGAMLGFGLLAGLAAVVLLIALGQLSGRRNR